jgi:hypothetical protein
LLVGLALLLLSVRSALSGALGWRPAIRLEAPTSGEGGSKP